MGATAPTISNVLVVINKTRHTIHRHRASSAILDVDISKQLIGDRGLHRENTVNRILILTNPTIRQ
nr:hypothetical protein XPJYXGBL_XPJYXGBL_CDS_0002 [Microvirus sp.]